MTSVTLKGGILFGIALLLALCILHQYDPTLMGLLGRREGFEDAVAQEEEEEEAPAMPTESFMDKKQMRRTTESFEEHEQKKMGAANVGGVKMGAEGFADLASMEGPAAFASAEAPAGCYPRDQLTPTELLPADQNTIYAQQNPMGVGSLKGKNFLSAGALIGVNTVGQSLRNANLQLRSEPPNPQVPVSIFLQSTIGPDVSHRPLEVGS
jgi:hypothetical protein